MYTSEEFVKSNSKMAQDTYHTIPVISVAYALTALEMKDREMEEAIRLSKIEALREVIKEVEELTGETYSTLYRNEVVNILKSQITTLTNGK